MTTDVTNPPRTTPAAPGTVAPRNRSLWEITAYFLVAVGLLWWLGGWALPFVVLAIILMVILHELGHLLTARLTGMKASQFFVGFGPRLWSRQFGETEVGIKAIWAGGYVRIPGMTTLEEIDPADEPRSFRQATFPRRVLVASAGSLVHLVLALVLAFGVMLAVGQVSGYHDQIAGFDSWVGVKANPAQIAGLKVGDVIVAVDGRTDNTGLFLEDAIAAHAGRTVTLLVLRNGHDVTLNVTPALAARYDAATHKTVQECSYQWCIGIDYESVVTHALPSVVDAVPDAIGYLGSVIKALGVGMYHVFSPSGVSAIAHADVSSSAATSATFTNNYRPTSIYGIGRWLLQVARQNPSDLLVLFMVLNLAIGLMNMLPMLPLDGGYVAVAIYERIRTRRGRQPYRADINKLTPVVYLFVVFLLFLALSSLYLDIAHPINL